MTPRRTLLSIAAAALTLTGLCAAPAQAAPSACALLTPAQVGAAAGAQVGAGDPIGSTGCQWTAKSDPGIRVTLTLQDAEGWEMMKTPLPHITKTQVGGVGEDAFYTTLGTLTTLSVKKGGTVFIVRVYGVKGLPKQMSLEKSLAANVAGKL